MTSMRGRLVSDSLVVAQRNLRRYLRNPQLIVFIVIQPVMFILLFTYVFGGAIEVPGLGYTAFLIPGIIAQTVTFNTASTSVGVAEDLKGGIIDRFRSLPMSRAAVLAGRVLSDSVMTLFTLVLMGVVGYAVGFRIVTSVGQTLLAVGLLEVFGFAFSWIAAVIGLTVREPEAAQSAGFLWLFPLNFASSVFVPPATMPSALAWFAGINPITKVVDATRALTVGGYPCDAGMCTDAAGPALITLAWCVGIVVLFVPLAAWRWRALD